MLVYCKEPMGYISIGGKRIYGEFFSYGKFGPTEITHTEYIRNFGSLIECPITPEWFRKKTGKLADFPVFYPTKVYHMEDSDIIKIAHALGVKYNMGHAKVLPKEHKTSIKKAILWTLDKLVGD